MVGIGGDDILKVAIMNACELLMAQLFKQILCSAFEHDYRDIKHCLYLVKRLNTIAPIDCAAHYELAKDIIHMAICNWHAQDFMSTITFLKCTSNMQPAPHFWWAKKYN